jgi:hypothetical protein
VAGTDAGRGAALSKSEWNITRTCRQGEGNRRAWDRIVDTGARDAIGSCQTTRLERPMGAAKTISATDFKATCLQVLDRVQSGEWTRVEVTKRGRRIACGFSRVR